MSAFCCFCITQKCKPQSNLQKKRCTWAILNSALLLGFGVAEQDTAVPVCLKSPDDKMGEEEGEKAALQHELFGAALQLLSDNTHKLCYE